MKTTSKLASVLLVLATAVGAPANATPGGPTEFARLPAASKPKADGPEGYQLQPVGKNA